MIHFLALDFTFAGGCFAATRRHLPRISRVAGALFAGVSVVMTALIVYTDTPASAVIKTGEPAWVALFVVVLIERTSTWRLQRRGQTGQRDS
jgi:hypothetical protein